MKSAIKVAALSVLILAASGCKHKTRRVIPPQMQAPVVTVPPPVSPTTLPTVPLPQTPNVAVEKPETPAPAPKHRHRSKSSTAKTTPPVTPPAAEAAEPPKTAQTAAPPPANSPIGQLSTSSDIVGEANRSDTVKLIDTTEKTLDGMKRPLSADEQATATQIRAFLDKARQALAGNDLDGAHTLATKAKVLLDELTKE